MLKTSFANIHFQYYVVAVTISILSVLVSVLRWRSILQYYGIQTDYFILTKIYMMSIFYNLTLPGSLGGDAVKAHRIAQQDGQKGTLVASVPLERISGLIGLFPVMLIGIVFSYSILPKTVFALTAIFAAVTIFGIVGLSSSTFRDGVAWLLDRPRIAQFEVQKQVRSMISTFQSLRDPWFLLAPVGYSIIYILLSIVVIYFFAKAAGVSIPLLYLAAVIPIQRLLQQIPITVGGVGLKEGIFVYFFGFVGVSPEQAVLISVLGYITQLINAMIGGILDFR